MTTSIMVLCALFISVSDISANCGKNPNPDLFISAPDDLEALNGSCLQIPCAFSLSTGHTLDNSKQFNGVWIKNDPRIRFSDNIVFNSSGTVSTYQMEIIGNLSWKNCTTLFSNVITDYAERYYFRLENDAFRATASCNHIQIKVQESSWTPSIKISGEQKEKELVTISCSAVTPCPHSPPKLTWDKHQDSVIVMETNSDGTLTTTTRLNLTLTDAHDGYNLTCSAAYPVSGGVKTAENKTTLSVTYGPKNTSVSVSPSGPLSAGQLVNLSCYSRAKPPVDHFTWFRITSQGPVNVSEGATYSFNFTDATQGQYHCEATNEVGKQRSAVIQLHAEGVEAGDVFSHIGAVAGGMAGVLVIIIAALVIWRLMCRPKTDQQTQSLTAETIGTTDYGPEVHYGQIDFSKLRHDPLGESPRDKDSETVYAQVKISNMAGNSVYAQVKKN